MTNPFTKRIPHNHSFYILLMITAIAGLILWVKLNGYDQIEPQQAHADTVTQIPTKTTNVAVKPKTASKVAPSSLTEAQEAVKQQIIEIAKEEGYEAPLFLTRLAKCESSLNPNAKSKSSSARGLFQIIGKVTDAQAYSVDYSTRWTIKQLMAGHASWWACTEIVS